jgi:hypothetical protein
VPRDHTRVRCAICQRDDVRLTREHVFARWLTQRVGSAGAARVIASVCADCNAGWMSALEVAFRRLLTGPRTGPIAAPDRVALCRWFTKTAVLVADAQDATLVAPADRPALMRGMPGGVEVFIARRRRATPRIRHARDADGSVAISIDDLVAHVAPPGVLAGHHGTRLWPLRTHAVRWDTLPVVT